MLDADPRYHEAMEPLAAFCEQHGYRWRWKIARPGQWDATVQILDPRQQAKRNRVIAWYGASSVDELTALKSAIRYAIEEAQRGINADKRSPPAPPSLKGQ